MLQHVSKTALFAAAATLFATGINAQQTTPPAAGQGEPTLTERAGRLVDRLTGDTAATADVDMRRVLAAHEGLDPKPIEGLSPEEARRQPSPADAVKAVLKNEGKDPTALNAASGIKIQDMAYETAGGSQPVRIYTPASAAAGQKLPVIVYYHGGGWVIANIETYDATPRAMAEKAGAIVVSVGYRFAPENKFPAAHDDAVAAYKWVLANANAFGGDPARVAVMGESAGGNLAINVAIAARDQKLQAPVHQVLIYPVAGVDLNTPSYQEYENAKPLNKAMIGWFVGHLTKGEQDKQDPRLDVIGKANLKGLPSTTIVTAQIDPLQSDGFKLGDLLTNAGVATRYQNYEGVTHEFFGMNAVVAKAETAQMLVAQELKKAFGQERRAAN